MRGYTMDQQETKEFKWKVVRVGGVTIAQGYQCPDCRTISTKAKCDCQKYKDKKKDP